MHQRNVSGSASPCWLRTALVAAALAAFAAPPARADFIISAETVSAVAGSTGNALDVTLQNTGPDAVTIGGFGFTLTFASGDVTFTDVTTGTSAATYVFDGDSFFGPSIGMGIPGEVIGSDLSLSGLGTSVGAGETVGLGHLLFDVSSSASTGSFSLVFSPFPATSLSDANPDPLSNGIPINQFVDGQINILGAAPAAPTPSAVLGGSALLGFLGVLAIRRRATLACRNASPAQ